MISDIFSDFVIGYQLLRVDSLTQCKWSAFLRESTPYVVQVYIIIGPITSRKIFK